ncbi:MAG: hypothetical protein ACD_41C00152G0003 [uncultured bacterium]|nr:MAG: hypothetical protein ACD_41C00152G0003 [uncultured bacterium]
MSGEIVKLGTNWVQAKTDSIPAIVNGYYCETRDVFQARLDSMRQLWIQQNVLSEDLVYLGAALAGEIGNNSFDHNGGHWPDVPGVFFGYDLSSKTVVLADRGQGVLATLKKVKPELANDQEALETAFKEKLSGRAPENRGNGLKFVRQTIHDQKLHLSFYSGTAQAELNDTIITGSAQHMVQGCLAILSF